jgi:hypothetical protein
MLGAPVYIVKAKPALQTLLPALARTCAWGRRRMPASDSGSAAIRRVYLRNTRSDAQFHADAGWQAMTCAGEQDQSICAVDRPSLREIP